MYFNISSDKATQRRPLLKPHKTKRLRGAGGSGGEQRSAGGTNDFSLSGNSAEDTFDMRFVIAFATGILYCLGDVKWGENIAAGSEIQTEHGTRDGDETCNDRVLPATFSLKTED